MLDKMSIYNVIGKCTDYNGDETTITTFLDIDINKDDREIEKLYHSLYPKYYFSLNQLSVENARRSPKCELYQVQITECSTWKVLSPHRYIWAESQNEAEQIASKTCQRFDLNNQNLYTFHIRKEPVKIIKTSIKEINQVVQRKIDFTESQEQELKKLHKEYDDFSDKIKPLEAKLEQLRSEQRQVRVLIDKRVAENKIAQEYLPLVFETSVVKFQGSMCGNCGGTTSYRDDHTTDCWGGFGTKYTCMSRNSRDSYSSYSRSSFDDSNRFGF